jgi:hypothetical protein
LEVYRDNEISYSSSHIQDIDPSLTDILRRPPVGSKSNLASNSYTDYYNTPPPPFNSQYPINNNFSQSQSTSNFQNYPNQQQTLHNDSYTRYPSPNTNYQRPQEPYRIPQNQQINAPQPQRSQKRESSFNFSEEQNKESKEYKAKVYQEELQRQVQEKALAKQREKEIQNNLDKKMAHESIVYNPFGKGGGGAPIRDKDGNILADLSQVKAELNSHRENNNLYEQQQQQLQQLSRQSSNEMMYQQQQFQQNPYTPYNNNNNYVTTPKSEDNAFGRGGLANGSIFGDQKVKI